jgi:CxxC motif-containing protein
VEIDGGKVTVTGNACSLGEEFGRQEAVMPMRPLVTSVLASGGNRPRLWVCGTGDIPLTRLLEAMDTLEALIVEAPVTSGQVVMQNLLDLGIDIVAKESLAVGMRNPP